MSNSPSKKVLTSYFPALLSMTLIAFHDDDGDDNGDFDSGGNKCTKHVSLCTRHHTKHFICISSLNVHNPMKYALHQNLNLRVLHR